MSDIIIPDKNPVFHINRESDDNRIAKICYALSGEERVQLMRSVLYYPKSISALSNELGIPISNVSRYAEALAEAGLISISYQPGIKGHTKFCSASLLSFQIMMETSDWEKNVKQEINVEMPLGMFTYCDIQAPCGMISSTEHIDIVDNTKVFFSPRRIEAECLWFDRGFIGWDFPTNQLARCNEITFSFEVCSETNGYNNNWPSDITVRLNGNELTTFTSPGDFGGRRGKYTPEFWPTHCTQFGLLKKVTVDGEGVHIDNALVNTAVTFPDLKLTERDSVRFELGIKDTSKYRGGINIFGKNFGDFNQSIIMTAK